LKEGVVTTEGKISPIRAATLGNENSSTRIDISLIRGKGIRKLDMSRQVMSVEEKE